MVESKKRISPHSSAVPQSRPLPFTEYRKNQVPQSSVNKKVQKKWKNLDLLLSSKWQKHTTQDFCIQSFLLNFTKNVFDKPWKNRSPVSLKSLIFFLFPLWRKLTRSVQGWGVGLSPIPLLRLRPRTTDNGAIEAVFRFWLWCRLGGRYIPSYICILLRIF